MSDSSHSKSSTSTLLDKLGVALATAVSGIVIFLLASVGRPLVDAISQASTKEFLLRLTALLGFALSIAGAYIIHLRSQLRKPLSSKFEFDEYGGYYVDRKTGRGVCARCLSDGLVIHLMNVDGTNNGAKMCNACQSVYRSKPSKSD